jgi:hypothetical protein
MADSAPSGSHPVTRLVLTGQIKHDELIRDPDAHLVADAVVLDNIRVEQAQR